MSNYDENEFKEIVGSETGSGSPDVVNTSDHHEEKPEARCYICGRS